ncbi:MAG TPA: TetR family transcriptional regulator C-terminal domain-containing protein [Micromonosporaceae bacterium]|nr:TetR family transcriptional regulator C-terminal domain-containing protein [Micromonosporaceae bacterium]
MPRQVDHDGRRRQIAAAVCRLADERGLEGVTVRDVAGRAGVSTGAVQRCFRTKEQMLVFALDHIGAQITGRIRARIAEDPAQPAGAVLGHAANEISLLHEDQRAEARVWLSFVAQAAVSPPLAEILKGNYAELQQMFARLVAAAVDSVDPQREARKLLALTDGLTTHALVGHLTPETALDILNDHLRTLLEP